VKVIIFDTETTGFENPEVIEAAWVHATLKLDMNLAAQAYCERFKPSTAITLGAMATHHIIMSDLEDCRPSSEFQLPEIDMIIGHNVDFDWKVIGSPEIKRICTLALSRWMFPKLDSHSQSAMLYHFFPHSKARELCKNAHSALADVANCRLLFHCLIDEMVERNIPCGTWDEIHAASEIARIPTVMPFGKHKRHGHKRCSSRLQALDDGSVGY